MKKNVSLDSVSDKAPEAPEQGGCSPTAAVWGTSGTLQRTATAWRWRETATVVLCILSIIFAGEWLPDLGHRTTIYCVAVMTMLAGVAMMRRTMGRTPAAECIFMLAVTLLTIGIMLNASWFSAGTGFSDASPNLVNDDASRAWNNAIAFHNGTWQSEQRLWNLYGVIISLFFIPFGPSIAIALTSSMIAGAAVLLFTSLTAWRLTRSRAVATVALVATAMVGYLMASATILVKDIWVVAGFAIAAYGLCQWRRQSPWWVAAAMIPVALVRPNIILAMIAGVLIIGWTMRREPGRRWPAMLAVIVFGLAVIVPAKLIANTPSIHGQLSDSGAFIMGQPEDRMAFFNIVGAETAFSPIRKILFLPLLALTQFIIPLPWNLDGDAMYGPTLAMAHISIPWYIFGAVVAFYLCAAKRSAGDRKLLALTLWGVFCWLIPVYVAMGTVPRYALCAVPLMAPAVGAVLIRCSHRRALWIWLAVFCVLMAAGLFCVYNIQHSVMS